MAHGGHHSSIHHSHYRSRKDSSGSWLSIAISIILMIIYAQQYNIGGKVPLKQESEITAYVYDEQGYFSDTDKMVEGLEYLRERTNVQMVIMSTEEEYSDSKAEETYHLMFKDEEHVLVIVPTALNSSIIYYAIGDNAGNVIDNKAMNYLLDIIYYSTSGSKWNDALKIFANKLVE